MSMLGRAVWALLCPAVLAAQAAGVPPDTTARPIGLDEAVRLAQRNAPAAVQARGQMRTSRAQVRSAYGAFIPNLSISAGSTRQAGERFDQLREEVVPLGASWQYSDGLTLGLTLFDAGRRFFDIGSARANVDAAAANDIAQRYRVALDVSQQYYNALAARESESAARAQLQQAELQLRAASARVAAGSATRSDSLRAVIQVGNAQLALLTAQNGLRVANAGLTRLVGTAFVVTANPADTLTPLTPVADSATLIELAENGPQVEQARAQLAAARAARRAARTPYLPTLSASYNINRSAPDEQFGFTSDRIAASNSFRLSMSYPLFNQFTREEQVVRAEVAQDNAEAALRDAQLSAQQNLVQYLGQLHTAEQRIAIQRATVDAAEEDLRVQQQRYAVGASTQLDVLTSQTQLSQARSALIQARQDYRVARAQIEAIVGRELR